MSMIFFLRARLVFDINAIGNGDPTTPGWPSTKNGPRYNNTQLFNPPFEPPFPLLPKIPIQPLSIQDAQHLLAVRDFASLTRRFFYFKL